MKIDIDFSDDSAAVLVISMGAIMQAADGLEHKANVVQGMGHEAAADRWYQAAVVLRIIEGKFRRIVTELSGESSTVTPS